MIQSVTDCNAVKAIAHELQKIDTSLLFRRNCTIQRVLKTGTWSSQMTITAFYLRGVIHRHMDIFTIGPVVEAQ